MFLAQASTLVNSVVITGKDNIRQEFRVNIATDSLLLPLYFTKNIIPCAQLRNYGLCVDRGVYCYGSANILCCNLKLHLQSVISKGQRLARSDVEGKPRSISRFKLLESGLGLFLRLAPLTLHDLPLFSVDKHLRNDGDKDQNVQEIYCDKLNRIGDSAIKPVAGNYQRPDDKPKENNSTPDVKANPEKLSKGRLVFLIGILIVGILGLIHSLLALSGYYNCNTALQSNSQHGQKDSHLGSLAGSPTSYRLINSLNSSRSIGA